MTLRPFSRRAIGVSGGALLAIAGALLIPQAANASTSDCAKSSYEVCYWNAGGYSGTPTSRLQYAPRNYRDNWNISDNILSSAISHNTGSYLWCVTNVTTIAGSELLFCLQPDVGVNVSGTSKDNKADDIQYIGAR